MSHPFTNKLIDSTSPYLLQHAHNPVQWYPWSAEALARSRSENKPIFLSIGYSACHWCHVMEREVFENPDIAALMNEHFINIKVDREERPDLDDLYMLATQVMSGAGGWPMYVWLTPDLEPFYAGTYFPPADGHGRPGFPKLELALASAWKSREADLRSQAQRVVEAIKIHADESTNAPAPTPIPLPAWLQSAVEQNADRFDDEHGGFGHAPKFPPHATLLLFTQLLAHPHPQRPSATRERIQQMLTTTLDGMARGGIYDHIGGAFSRYSTDERWLVPHFEKMLYDNAQLAPVYARASQLLQRDDYARHTLDFWLREMTSPDGAFFSTLDADSEGAEGKFYVWTVDDIYAAIGHTPDAELLCEHLGITTAGNWHESPVPGGCVPCESETPEELASRIPMDAARIRTHLDQLLLTLRAYRALRIPPARDDKILTGWCGLMISALASSGAALHEPRYLDAARRAVTFLHTQHTDATGRLLRTSRNGHAHTLAFLEDHAFLLLGLLDLHDATRDPHLLQSATTRADTLLREFQDQFRGGFFFISEQHEKLFVRMKNAGDNATPSANGVTIRALLRLSELTGNSAYRTAALRAVAAFAPHIQRNPSYFPTILTGLVEHPLPLPANQNAVSPLPSHILSLAPIAPQSAIVGEKITLPILVTIAAGFHLRSPAPSEKEAIATVVRIHGTGPLARAAHITYPEPLSLHENGLSFPGYAGPTQFLATLQIPTDIPLGSHTLRAIIEAQACTSSSCLPPQVVGVDFTLIIAAP